jgi:hypothetical protein
MGYDLKTILETPAATFRQEYESIGPESNSIKNKKEKYLKKLYDL